MINWREEILKSFTPQVAKMTIVSDPDSLLSEEIIIQEIQSRGFEIVIYEDPILLRFLYESKYRSAWEIGASHDGDTEGVKELIVLLRGEENEFNELPYYILSRGRKLKFGLDRLFPQMNPGVLMVLDRSLLDALTQAQAIYSPHQLSENTTKDFILRHVFEIGPEMIKTPADLLRTLLRKHYREQRVPPVLDNWMIQMLQKAGRFLDWPLESIIPDRGAFLAFLQERWPAYLDSLESDRDKVIGEFATVYHPAFSGPAILPFEHDDVRIYIDNLFAEGWLKPISPSRILKSGETSSLDIQKYPAWVRMGIQSDPETERYTRLQKILQVLEAEFPPEKSSYTDWINLAQRWAEANALWYGSSKAKQRYEPLALTYEELRQRIDTGFPKWLQQSYGTLYNLASIDPVMVHQIPRFMAKGRHDANSRAALIIIDGMAFDQWVVIRNTLQHQLKDYKFTVNGSFAWIPTLTSVSRQSIFAGKAPMYFPDRIWDTQGEEHMWTQFWSDAGLTEYQIRYRHLAEDDTKSEQVRDDITDPQTRVLGLVIEKVDKIMHGMELGAAGMLNQTRQWAEQGDLAKLIRLLTENHYQIMISSDHGNIESIGFGRPDEKAAADLRGERVRIYPDENLRNSIKAKFPQAVEWKPIGLPQSYYPLMAPERFAFVQNGKHTVCHGGISIEEVIVPFIRIEKL